jgi:hypothetical protein
MTCPWRDLAHSGVGKRDYPNDAFLGRPALSRTCAPRRSSIRTNHKRYHGSKTVENGAATVTAG